MIIQHGDECNTSDWLLTFISTHRYIDDGDFSKFADDMEDEEDDEDEEEEEEEEEEEGGDENMEAADEPQEEGPLKKFLHDDLSEEVKKGEAVKNQLGNGGNYMLSLKIMYAILFN